jgi:hypothetical protein
MEWPCQAQRILDKVAIRNASGIAIGRELGYRDKNTVGEEASQSGTEYARGITVQLVTNGTPLCEFQIPGGCMTTHTQGEFGRLVLSD